MLSTLKKMKQYKKIEYGGKWDNKQGYRHKYGKKPEPDYKKTTYPWKNHQKSIRST
jgi:hypothetical protein